MPEASQRERVFLARHRLPAGPARSRAGVSWHTPRIAFSPPGDSMAELQMWIVSTFARATAVSTMMKTAWGWPLAESVHFMGLCLLVGSIFLFDLRLLGIARRIP